MPKKVMYISEAHLDTFSEQLYAIRMAIADKTKRIPSESDVMRQAIARWHGQLRKREKSK